MPLISEVGRRKWAPRLLIMAIATVLWLGIVLHLFPVWWMFVSSIKKEVEVMQFPPTLWPKNPNFGIYKLIWYTAGSEAELQFMPNAPPYIFIKNSFIITGAVMAIQIPITALMGYALSKLYGVRWNRIIFLFCIGTMMIPSQVSLIPSYLIIRHFPFASGNIPRIPFTDRTFPTYNFLSTYWAVILPACYNAFNILLFKGFFDTIPNEIISAARIDGASEFSIFRRIIFPLSKSVFAVVSYYTFSGIWNSFMWPLIVLQEEKLYPLSVYLYHFQYQLEKHGVFGHDPAAREMIEAGIGYNGLMAISIIQSIPVFVIFIIFREYLMIGIKLRGFK